MFSATYTLNDCLLKGLRTYVDYKSSSFKPYFNRLLYCPLSSNSFITFQIFLKVASNIHDGSGGLRQIQYDDVTDRGRYAARTRSASARSVEARTIFLPPDQRKVLGMSDNLDDDEDESVFTGKSKLNLVVFELF